MVESEISEIGVATGDKFLAYFFFYVSSNGVERDFVVFNAFLRELPKFVVVFVEEEEFFVVYEAGYGVRLEAFFSRVVEFFLSWNFHCVYCIPKYSLEKQAWEEYVVNPENKPGLNEPGLMF